MPHTIFIDFRVNNAEQFKEQVSEAANNNLYLTFGKVDAWPTENTPANSNSSIATTYEVWDNMAGGKRLLGSDFTQVIRRWNWTANTKYIAYDHLDPNMKDGSNTKMIVMNSKNAVYKCIANNRSANSTIEPTSVNPSIISSTSDGYLWKFLYIVSDMELLRFVTTNYIPVKTLTYDDGSLQWQVQNTAVNGGIHSIYIANGGSNFANVQNISITFAGDGTGLAATIGINNVSNSINTITVTNPGTSYTYSRVTLSTRDSGTGANVRAIISPPGGHGSNPLYELGGKDILISARIKYDENGVLPVTNDYRQIAIIKDPLVANTGKISTALAFSQASSLTCEGMGDYLQDELVYQGASLATATYVGRVLSWTSSLSKLLLINTTGTPKASETIIGATSATSRILTSVGEGYMKKNTGLCLYVDNIPPITRSSDQTEELKLLVRF